MSTDGAAPTALDEIDLAVARSWPVVMFVGLLTLVIGIMVVAWPDETLKVLSILFGIQLLMFGVFRLISAFSSDSLAPGLVGFIGVIGMIGMIAGVVVLRNPFETVAVLATVLGVVWIVGGSIDLISSIADRRLTDRPMAAFSALVSIIAGVVIVSWPTPTLAVIAWIAGIYLITFGVLFCLGAFRLRQLEG
jgi:uncharacterized membrane protein HdeD (DUF308 family)